tara:strand:+ start:178 stop:321 length:144 start_codon:yes stop_codon:yes gene_type:complete
MMGTKIKQVNEDTFDFSKNMEQNNTNTHREFIQQHEEMINVLKCIVE